jgi:hypothetical protein
MHHQDKSGDEIRPPWHRPVIKRESSYEEDQAWLLSELIEEFPALMTFDEARIARIRDRENWSESDQFEISLRGLMWGGMVRRQGELLVPVRPVRQMAELGFSIG